MRDIGGNVSHWRTETIQIDRVLPTDRRPIRARRSPTATSSPSTGRTIAPASPRSSGSSTAAGPHQPVGHDHRRRAAQLDVRVRDNAGNTTAWVTHTITVQLPPDTTAPTDNTNIPTQWRTAAYPIVLAAADDIDGVGVDYIEYLIDDREIDNGQPGDTVTVTEDGTHERPDARLGQGRQPTPTGRRSR